MVVVGRATVNAEGSERWYLSIERCHYHCYIDLFSTPSVTTFEISIPRSYVETPLHPILSPK